MTKLTPEMIDTGTRARAALKGLGMSKPYRPMRDWANWIIPCFWTVVIIAVGTFFIMASMNIPPFNGVIVTMTPEQAKQWHAEHDRKEAGNDEARRSD